MQVRRIRVQIETIRSRVIGVVQLPTEGYRSRTTDFLNAHETGFIALTDVEVQPLEGGAPTRHEFVAVGSRHIVTLAEVADLGVIEDDGPQQRPMGLSSTPPPG
jgi:hypothetical protein